MEEIIKSYVGVNVSFSHSSTEYRNCNVHIYPNWIRIVFRGRVVWYSREIIGHMTIT